MIRYHCFCFFIHWNEISKCHTLTQHLHHHITLFYKGVVVLVMWCGGISRFHVFFPFLSFHFHTTTPFFHHPSSSLHTLFPFFSKSQKNVYILFIQKKQRKYFADLALAEAYVMALFFQSLFWEDEKPLRETSGDDDVDIMLLFLWWW